MEPLEQRICTFARQALGTPFRLHGRKLESGVDCVGLVAAVLERAGIIVPPLPRYAMRNLTTAQFAPLIKQLSLASVNGPLSAGDILVLKPAPAQLHLGIMTSCGLIHADARLGKVVLSPARPDWPLITVLRHSKEEN